MTSKLMRGSIWIAIGSLIAAAIVCVIWVLVGNQDGIIGRAFLTILLLAAFAGIAIVESNLAARRPEWLVLASMVSWIIALLVGAIKIWLPDPEPDYMYGFRDPSGGMRVLQFLLVIGILQLALLHVRLFLRASQRYVTTFTRVIVMVTFAMLALLVAMLVFFLTFPDQLDYDDLYWRIVIALAILAAVGTTLIPLLNALFAPRAPRPPAAVPQAAPVQAAQPMQAWPTYADGRTPLPVMPDGSPDWNAYYTGYPTYAAPAAAFPVVDAAPEPPSAPATPAAPDPGAAPQSPQMPPMPPAPPAPPGSNGSFPPPPAMPDGAQ
ncbi:hypothetical protein ACU045_06180 [Microbacterium sp. MAHUQ-60]|uniref:hypothetical protein n=1 Tax=unclassified Microbacterium TaxID=2609290 RepID=UPI003613CAB9